MATKLTVLLLVSFLLFSTAGFLSVGADESQAYWIESLGGSGWLRLNAATQLDDGSIIAVGWVAMEKYNGDVLVIKFSPYGIVEWAKVYGGSKDDYPTGVTIGPNGDIIVVGATESYGAGSYDVWVLRLYPDGRIRWQRTYGGPGDDRAMDVAIDHTGKIVIVGGTTSYGANPGKSSDLWILKLSGTGDVVWSKTYGRTNWDWGDSVAIDDSNNIYVGGVYWLSVSAPYNHFGEGGNGWILKLDSNGDLIWNKILGGVDNEWVSGISLLDGDVIFVGSTKSFGAGDYDLWVGRLNSSGDLKWVRTYGGTGVDVGTSLAVFNPYCGFLTGYTYSASASGGSKTWIISFSPSTGKADWQKIYGGKDNERAFSLVGSPKGIVILGSTSSFGKAQTSAWILKLPTSGAIFNNGVKDSNLIYQSFKALTYSPNPTIAAPHIEPSEVKPTVKESSAIPKDVSLPVILQYYYGPKPPETTTTGTSTTTTSVTSTTTSTTSTATFTTTTTSTVTQTSTATPTSTTTSTTPTETSVPSSTPSSSSAGGGICGPGLIMLLGIAVLAIRRRL